MKPSKRQKEAFDNATQAAKAAAQEAAELSKAYVSDLESVAEEGDTLRFNLRGAEKYSVLVRWSGQYMPPETFGSAYPRSSVRVSIGGIYSAKKAQTYFVRANGTLNVAGIRDKIVDLLVEVREMEQRLAATQAQQEERCAKLKETVASLMRMGAIFGHPTINRIDTGTVYASGKIRDIGFTVEGDEVELSDPVFSIDEFAAIVELLEEMRAEEG